MQGLNCPTFLKLCQTHTYRINVPIFQDPFFLRVRSRSDYKGTKDEPIIVDALDNYRMVGCVCEEHACHIKWMWLIEGRPKRCACGHWFSLKQHEGPDRYKLPL